MTSPQRIAVSSSENLRALGTLGQRSLELIGSILSRRLSTDHAALFADPVFSDSGDQTDWYTSRSGEVLRLNDLAEEDKLAVEERLGSVLDDIRSLAAELEAGECPEDQRLGEALRNATIFPGSQSVYVVKETNGSLQPLLIDWASEPDGRSGPRSAGLVAWTPRRRAASRQAVSPAAPLPKVAPEVAHASLRRPGSLGWLVWLLALSAGGLTIAILSLLLPACGLVSNFDLNFCHEPPTLAQSLHADELDRLTRERNALENRISVLERDVNKAKAVCRRAASPPPPKSESELLPIEPDEIDERLQREDAQSGHIGFALVWESPPGLNPHMTCPNGETIRFQNLKGLSCGGVLNVNMNTEPSRSKEPVGHTYSSNPAPGINEIHLNYFDANRQDGSQSFALRVLLADGMARLVSGDV